MVQTYVSPKLSTQYIKRRIQERLAKGILVKNVMRVVLIFYIDFLRVEMNRRKGESTSKGTGGLSG